MGAFDIQGKNCVFQLKIDDVYKTVVCAKSFTFNPVTDMKETTTVGSGFWKEFRPRKLSYTITFNGMLQVESDISQEKIKTMFDYQLQFLPLPYRLIYTDNSSNVMVVDGWVYVTSNLLDASPVNLVNGTTELQGNGPIGISDAIPDLVDINIVSLGDNSIPATFQFKLFNSSGAVVFDSGMLPGASGGNLTHPVNVTGQIQKGTYSIFWQGLSQSIGNAFQLDAPPTKSEVFDNSLTNESTFGIQDYDFTANRTVTFTLGVYVPPPTCVPPMVIQGLNNPTAIEGTPWSTIVTLAGSQPFTLSNITKPSWIDISISGSTITLSGNPVAGLNQGIGFDITNACGTINHNDQIDVSANPNAITLDINYTETLSGFPAVVTGFHLYVNAVNFLNIQNTGTESTVVNPGDTIELRIAGTSGRHSHIDVTGTVDGLIMNEDSTQATMIRTFVAVAGNDYTINATTTT
jgi:hypothetical protein